MAKAKIPGYRQINGRWGEVWLDGDLVSEIEEFESKITANREDVEMAGSLSVDSKITSLKGEGSMKLKKVYSRGVQKLLRAWQAGRDPRCQIVGKLKDPDAYGTERVVIDNVWFNELTLMQFTKGPLTTDLPFGFTPEDVRFPDLIEVQ
ncbi:MAG: terminase [Anaerosolibacter sp.]|jgi:hypothetical protein|uniref:phage tail tube protein n=1 Tax=Anaerosolibacter sp. TaxID=1872527 RepID=UPI002605DE02|nr:phage tail tube protein [Anaerosolibacter sp.]MDF2546145.1 terminase [Anaerosolibacter sp.]